MTTNDIFKRIRYTFHFSDEEAVRVFKLSGFPIKEEQIGPWMKKEEDPAYELMPDKQLAAFLNGFIALKRGKREGPSPEPEIRINNNLVLRKLKIALELKTEDIQGIFAIAQRPISSHEITSFFRKHSHPKYRMCKDQYLRNFLQGLQIRYGR